MDATSKEDISSIYDDLVGQGDLGLIIHNLQTRNKQLQLHVTSLEEDIQKLCNKITEMKQTQENLSRNISELYKTAKNEIERKDRLIAELQSKVDDMVFKRNTAPSNFGFKRQREEVIHCEETYKRLKNDDKSEQNREKNKDNSVQESELSKSSYYNNDKKSEYEVSRNYRNNDTRDHMKHESELSKSSYHNIDKRSEYEANKNYRNNDTRDNMKHPNIVRNDERKLDNRDHSRYGRDFKRSSNSRNYRRDNERNFRRYNDKERRSSRDRDYKADRFDEYREPKNKNENFRNEKFSREQNRRSDDRESIGSKREVKNEPRFSSVELTRSTSDIVEVDDCLNVSREEGEIIDLDSDDNPVSPDKNKYDSGININQKNTILCDIKINPPGDKISSLHDFKCIDKNQNVNKKEETVGKNIEKNYKGEKLDNKEKKDNIQIMENITTKESPGFVERNLKSVKECDAKIISSVNEDFMEYKEKSIEDREINTEKITIISQVVLNEPKTGNIKSKFGTKVISKEVIEPETFNKIQCSPEHKIVKVDKPIRECGVPRNLTDELDINIDKLNPIRDNKKDLYAGENLKERIDKKISSMFDTPIKVNEQNLDNSVNLKPTFDIKHDDLIPELEKTDTKEAFQSNIEVETSTPVSEFKIFKANFHNLEKSNNVNIHFQTDISNVPMNSAETHKIIESKESNTESQKTVLDGQNQNISEGRLQNLVSEDLVNMGKAVKNENMVSGNANDMSNISLDLLNTNLAMCKAEDFPNLTSCTESKDMPNILTTVSKSSRKHENSLESSSKPSNIKNVSNKPYASTNTAVEENVILEEKKADDKSFVSTNIASTSVNISVSPNPGNTRKKRKRCVIGWVE